MPPARDYYEVLGVPRMADAAEIRRAYRAQALRYHPDKNADRIQEATEMFKRVGEAYAVLRDAKLRAAYDRGADLGAAGGPRPGATSAATAHDLFSEVFGKEFVAGLGRVATGAASATASAVSGAVDRCSKSQVLGGTVAAGFSAIAVDREVEAVAAEEACRRKGVDTGLLKSSLLEHEEKRREFNAVRSQQAKAANQRALKLSSLAAFATLAFLALCYAATRVVLLRAVAALLVIPEGVLLRRAGVSISECMSVLEKHQKCCQREAQRATDMRKDLLASAEALRASQRELAKAQSKAREARREAEDAERDGASLSGAARVGLHFIGKLVQGSSSAKAIE